MKTWKVDVKVLEMLVNCLAKAQDFILLG